MDSVGRLSDDAANFYPEIADENFSVKQVKIEKNKGGVKSNSAFTFATLLAASAVGGAVFYLLSRSNPCVKNLNITEHKEEIKTEAYKVKEIKTQESLPEHKEVTYNSSSSITPNISKRIMDESPFKSFFDQDFLNTQNIYSPPPEAFPASSLPVEAIGKISSQPVVTAKDSIQQETNPTILPAATTAQEEKKRNPTDSGKILTQEITKIDKSDEKKVDNGFKSATSASRVENIIDQDSCTLLDNNHLISIAERIAKLVSYAPLEVRKLWFVISNPDIGLQKTRSLFSKLITQAPPHNQEAADSNPTAVEKII